jgi:alpha-ketoglutarate-dependent taurine dioxygenase
MSALEVRDLHPAFGAEVRGLTPTIPLDAATCAQLRELFDERGVLVFPGLDLGHREQLWISKMLIGHENEPDRPGASQTDDRFYVSNRDMSSAAPFGRLQFHADTMWADDPFEVLSLFGKEVEQPTTPTVFVSGVHAWETLPDDLKARVDGLSALHTAGEVRRGDLADVLVSSVASPPTTVKPLALRHPRTGKTVLYACEQMTKEIVGLAPAESEQLLEELFDHLYDPAGRWEHQWQQGDFVVWDNIAMQHARPNVVVEGPARTLRKAASPVPQLTRSETPIFSAGR